MERAMSERELSDAEIDAALMAMPAIVHASPMHMRRAVYRAGWQARAGAPRDWPKDLLDALKGCAMCDHDEAEGGLVCHCHACCFKVTQAAWLAIFGPQTALPAAPSPPGPSDEANQGAQPVAFKERLSEILMAAINKNDRYTFDEGHYIRWGAVERDILAAYAAPEKG